MRRPLHCDSLAVPPDLDDLFQERFDLRESVEFSPRARLKSRSSERPRGVRDECASGDGDDADDRREHSTTRASGEFSSPVSPLGRPHRPLRVEPTHRGDDCGDSRLKSTNQQMTLVG